MLYAVIALLCLNTILLFLVLRSRRTASEDTRRTESVLRGELESFRRESALSARDLREETQNSLTRLGEALNARQGDLNTQQKQQFELFAQHVMSLKAIMGERLDTFSRQMTDDATVSREADARLRTTVEESLKRIQDDTTQRLEAFARQLAENAKMAREEDERLRNTVDEWLKRIQEDNAKRLEAMRVTVDEKLHQTLEQRLGESFKLVSDRLEQVHKGLGEMQTLAAGVGDLKRVLSNVKTRGTLGEIQLGALLEEVLVPEQYTANVKPRPNSNAIVEYAVKMPGKDEEPVWLPIDAKFPTEDYQVLLDAYDRADTLTIEKARKSLAQRIDSFARDIHDKYVDPPHTTDFAILFLPTEGLYAEVLRIPGLWETLNRKYRVAITGPTTLNAFLNALQMGFRTLAIEKRSSEVWKVLGAVKTEFGKFGEVLDKAKKKMESAVSEIDTVHHRSNQIQKKLRSVESLNNDEAIALIGENEQ
jgi:DNA recombination protein RmuC